MTQSLANLNAIYSDMYKEVYGTRPRGVGFDTVEEAEKALDALYLCLVQAPED